MTTGKTGLVCNQQPLRDTRILRTQSRCTICHVENQPLVECCVSRQSMKIVTPRICPSNLESRSSIPTRKAVASLQCTHLLPRCGACCGVSTLSCRACCTTQQVSRDWRPTHLRQVANRAQESTLLVIVRMLVEQCVWRCRYHRQFAASSLPWCRVSDQNEHTPVCNIVLMIGHAYAGVRAVVPACRTQKLRALEGSTKGAVSLRYQYLLIVSQGAACIIPGRSWNVGKSMPTKHCCVAMHHSPQLLFGD